MRVSTKVASAFFITVCTFSSQAVTNESAVEKIVTNLVASAIANVNTEIELQIEKFTLDAANQLDVNPVSEYIPKVSITDLPSETKEDLTEQTDTAHMQVEKKDTKSDDGEQKA